LPKKEKHWSLLWTLALHALAAKPTNKTSPTQETFCFLVAKDLGEDGGGGGGRGVGDERIPRFTILEQDAQTLGGCAGNPKTSSSAAAAVAASREFFFKTGSSPVSASSFHVSQSSSSRSSFPTQKIPNSHLFFVSVFVARFKAKFETVRFKLSGRG